MNYRNERTLTSGQSWSGLLLDRYSQRPDEAELPALSHHLIAVSRRPLNLLRVQDGRSRETFAFAGAVQILAAGRPSRWRWDDQSDVFHVQLSPSVLAGVAESAGADPRRVEIVDRWTVRDEWIERACQSLADEVASPSWGERLYVDSLTAMFAVHLLRRHAARTVLPAEPRSFSRERLRRVIDYIRANLSGDVGLAELAAVAHLSPYHFARLFRRCTGRSPHQFVIAQRVERAKELLASRVELTLAQIAAAVGFCDQSHLNRHFKRLVGVSPSRFR